MEEIDSISSEPEKIIEKSQEKQINLPEPSNLLEENESMFYTPSFEDLIKENEGDID